MTASKPRAAVIVRPYMKSIRGQQAEPWTFFQNAIDTLAATKHVTL
jgi:hypothetical protein